MPRVRVRVPHLNVGGATRHRDDDVDVAGDVASYLIASGFVELVRGEHPDTPERPDAVEKAQRTRAPRERGAVA